MPYAGEVLAEVLGAAPEQACSAGTARDLAMTAFLKAHAIGGDFGFAVTAALATNRARRGSDRAHVAFQDARRTRTWRLAFTAPGSTRAGQEAAVARLALTALAASLGIGEPPREGFREDVASAAQADLVLGRRSHIGEPGGAVFPGAFNPLHDGHRGMRDDAEARLGQRVRYELCVANVDKPPLNHHDIAARLGQFAAGDVVLTNAPTFVTKARALGAVTFVVGADTIVRIADPRYYGGAEARDEAIEEMARIGCRFLVYGRVVGGRFRTLPGIDLPAPLAALCGGVPETAFRLDVSSTGLRRKR